MSAPEIVLTPEILDRFAEALRHAGAPLGFQIEPGLSDERIDEVVARVGVVAPPELRTLWSWGTAPATPRGANWEINPDFGLWPPDQAVQETKNYRLDPAVPRNTVAFGGPLGEGYLLVESADAGVSKVVYAFIDDPDTLVAAPSLGALFSLWAEQLAGGAYRYETDQWEPLDGPDTWFRR